jgi:hypothetical protein
MFLLKKILLKDFSSPVFAGRQVGRDDKKIFYSKIIIFLPTFCFSLL